jgi:hypothetical protein
MKKLIAILLLSAYGASAALAAEFAAADTDGSGAVSMEEARAAIPDLSEDAFKAADADASGDLSEEEFASLRS